MILLQIKSRRRPAYDLGKASIRAARGDVERNRRRFMGCTVGKAKIAFSWQENRGNGDLKVSMIDALGIGSVSYFGTLFFCDSPISAVTGLLKLLERNSRM